MLSSAFPDQKSDEDIIKEILQKGDFQTMEVSSNPCFCLTSRRMSFLFHHMTTAWLTRLTLSDARSPGSHQRLHVLHEDQVKTFRVFS